MAGLRWYLCVVILLLFITQSVSGSITVRNMVITPSGNLVSGEEPPQEVRVSFAINFIPEGGMTFSSSNSLGMFTDLENARWSYATVIDGNPASPLVESGDSLSINGWVLSYPSRRDLSVLVNLTGEVPAVSSTGKKTLVKVGVYNGGNEVYPGTAVIREANVILPGSPVVSGTTPAGQQSQSPATPPMITTAVPVPATPGIPAPQPSSLSIPAWVLTIIFLLVSFIPLGLLIFHDYFGLGQRSHPQTSRVRAGIAVLQVLCGIGLLSVLITIQGMYTRQVMAENGLVPVFSLLVLLLVSYVSLSAFALALGSMLSKVFRWTLKVHVYTGIGALILAPATIITLGAKPDSQVIFAGIALIAGLLTVLIALWQDHVLSDDLGSDLVSSISGFFQRIKHNFRQKKNATTDTGAAIAILNTRLARGEISLEEYTRLKDAIKK